MPSWQMSAGPNTRPLELTPLRLSEARDKSLILLQMTDTDNRLLWDVDFSLALHNRTGKYHIGRDILASCSDLIGDVFYWRIKLAKPPTGLAARIIGRAAEWENRMEQLVPSVRPRRRRLHLDPLTSLSTRICPEDAVLCHDLGPLTHPELFPAKLPKLYAKAYARINRVQPHMVFVSRASRNHFKELYGVPRNARVIYPQIRVGAVGGKLQPISIAKKPFFLTVGSIGARKNQINSMQAFTESGLADAGWSYMLCGALEPGSEEAISYAKSSKAIHVLPFVNDEELSWLYANASAFVLTSRLEGFGMPVAEALAHGLTPMVAANSVLEEVAGEEAISVNEEDITSIAGGFTALAKLPDASQHRARRKNQALRFSREAFVSDWRNFLSGNSAAAGK